MVVLMKLSYGNYPTFTLINFPPDHAQSPLAYLPLLPINKECPPASVALFSKYNRAVNFYQLSCLNCFLQLHGACRCYDAAHTDVVAACSAEANWLSYLSHSWRINFLCAHWTIPILPRVLTRFH